MSSDDLKPIIFYDIPSITPGHLWSPNTMKTRYCLGYKKLPYTTVWVELPDIAGLLQSKGITQSYYTLPAIEDPNTGAFIVDSLAIATYLDEIYPATPKVLSPAARAAMEKIGDVFSFGTTQLARANAGTGTAGAGASQAASSASDNARDLAPRLVFLILASERLNPVSKAYYHQTRGAWIGAPWTTLVDACGASPEKRAECVRQGIDAIAGIWRKITTTLYSDGESGKEEGSLDPSGGGHKFALGEEPCFLDFAVAGRIKFALDSLTPSEAASLTALDGGRLARLVDDLESYL